MNPGNDNPQADVFSSEDLVAIEAARQEQEAQDAADAAAEAATAPAAAPAAAATAPAAAPAAAAPAAAAPAPVASAPAPAAPAAPAAAPAAATPAAPAAPAPQPAHHVHAALRLERARADRLAAELAAAKAAAPAPKPPARPTAEQLAEVSQFDPAVASYVQQLEQQNQALATQVAKATPPAPKDFIPPKFDKVTQDAIDAVPALFDMQYNPDQTAFEVAVSEEAILRKLPEWKGKTDVELFTEAARRASERLGLTTAAPSPAALTPAQQALAAVAAAPAPAVALGDLAGGANPSNELPDFSKMSDADIMASLPVT